MKQGKQLLYTNWSIRMSVIYLDFMDCVIKQYLDVCSYIG